jgi:two-component system phosphate regulon response regulator PhoB
VAEPLKNRAEVEPRKRILVVDDEPEVTEYIVRILENAGFDARYVNDPLKAVDRAVEILPDLILLDFDMPKLLGPELSALLKRALKPRNVPIVFLSGMTDEDHRAIASLSGAVAYLDKPLDADKLIETIRSLL